MPAAIVPMKATLVEKPPHGPEWLFEIKWDGVRAIAIIDREEVRLSSRTGNSCEKQYPELSVIHHSLAAEQAILDTEIAVLDEKGISRFAMIQPRIAVADPNSIAHLARSRPVTMFAFDLLYLDGYDLRQVDLIERKRLLEQVLTPSSVLRLSAHFPDAGEQLLEAARENGLEGIVAKHASSCYESRRSREWLKMKVNLQQEFIICGFTTGERDHFGALVLGVYDRGKLVWVGNVGTGFDQKMLAQVRQRLDPLAIPKQPFGVNPKIPGEVTWVRPEVVCQVKFSNWTPDGRLRAPVFLGLRLDIDPHDVAREDADREAEEEKSVRAGSLRERAPVAAAKQEEMSVEVNGRQLKFTNLNKIFYPKEGYTKRDIINYYDSVAELILPHLKDRPLSLKRYPNGIHDDFFFQKDVKENFAPWLRTELIYHSETSEKPTRYVFAEDRASLLYLANLGCVDQNPWMSRIGTLDHPDFLLIDLDPHQCPFDKIVEAALLVRKKLDALELEGYPKTTGGDGMHIYVPLEPVYSYEEVRQFAKVLAMLVMHDRPDLFTTPRAVSKRLANKVYFDADQISKSKTIAAPYVLRAYDGAPVATPLAWNEVKPRLEPGQFHIRNARARFERTGDLFAGVLTKLQRLENSLEKLDHMVQGARKSS
jgi:bifunctional non-homologous end joining protein LigD